MPLVLSPKKQVSEHVKKAPSVVGLSLPVAALETKSLASPRSLHDNAQESQLYVRLSADYEEELQKSAKQQERILALESTLHAEQLTVKNLVEARDNAIEEASRSRKLVDNLKVALEVLESDMNHQRESLTRAHAREMKLLQEENDRVSSALKTHRTELLTAQQLILTRDNTIAQLHNTVAENTRISKRTTTRLVEDAEQIGAQAQESITALQSELELSQREIEQLNMEVKNVSIASKKEVENVRAMGKDLVAQSHKEHDEEIAKLVSSHHDELSTLQSTIGQLKKDLATIEHKHTERHHLVVTNLTAKHHDHKQELSEQHNTALEEAEQHWHKQRDQWETKLKQMEAVQQASAKQVAHSDAQVVALQDSLKVSKKALAAAQTAVQTEQERHAHVDELYQDVKVEVTALEKQVHELQRDVEHMQHVREKEQKDLAHFTALSAEYKAKFEESLREVSSLKLAHQHELVRKDGEMARLVDQRKHMEQTLATERKHAEAQKEVLEHKLLGATKQAAAVAASSGSSRRSHSSSSSSSATNGNSTPTSARRSSTIRHHGTPLSPISEFNVTLDTSPSPFSPPSARRESVSSSSRRRSSSRSSSRRTSPQPSRSSSRRGSRADLTVTTNGERERDHESSRTPRSSSLTPRSSHHHRARSSAQ